ncbi:MAG: hypothetical protein J5I90_05355 [Caldilineales bacterium]|nr:hypothetical protein [Caldilineales bacterium]
MKISRFKLLFLVVVLLASLVLVSTALAGSNVIHFRGRYAEALFSGVSTDGCVFTDALVFAGTNVQKSPPNPPADITELNVLVLQNDTCAGHLAFYSGYTELPDSAFQIDKKLTYAMLGASITIFDEFGNPMPVELSLSWDPTGPLVRSHNSGFTHELHGCSLNSHWNGTNRTATVSGSFDAGGMEITSLPLLFADMGTDKQGQVMINCEP